MIVWEEGVVRRSSMFERLMIRSDAQHNTKSGVASELTEHFGVGGGGGGLAIVWWEELESEVQVKAV